MPDDFTVVESGGQTAMADIDVCIAVADDLRHFYPGHPWRISCNHEAGTAVIDLDYPRPLHLRNARFMIYISTCIGPDGRKHVMRAGGDLLERWGLPRGAAKASAYAMAGENGLDASHMILKSKA